MWSPPPRPPRSHEAEHPAAVDGRSDLMTFHYLLGYVDRPAPTIKAAFEGTRPGGECKVASAWSECQLRTTARFGSTGSSWAPPVIRRSVAKPVGWPWPTRLQSRQNRGGLTLASCSYELGGKPECPTLIDDGRRVEAGKSDRDGCQPLEQQVTATPRRHARGLRRQLSGYQIRRLVTQP